MRVCQFRHDGKWTYSSRQPGSRRIRKACIPILQALGSLSNSSFLVIATRKGTRNHSASCANKVESARTKK
jgi:hypothetical protein